MEIDHYPCPKCGESGGESFFGKTDGDDQRRAN